MEVEKAFYEAPPELIRRESFGLNFPGGLLWIHTLRTMIDLASIRLMLNRIAPA